MHRAGISRRDFLATASAVKLSGGVPVRIPILVYHRLGLAVTDSMTLRTSVLLSQLETIRGCGMRFTALPEVVRRLANHDIKPERPIALTADDGHESVYSTLWPILRESAIPVTLFLYPSAISRASYAITWAQAREMVRRGGVTVGSHTFWHPNFRTEKRRLSPDAYRDFVRMQMVRSKQVLEQQLSAPVFYLAWPFGIYDEELIQAAKDAGYTAGFTIERRVAADGDRRMTIPRLLMTDQDVGARFQRLIGGQ